MQESTTITQHYPILEYDAAAEAVIEPSNILKRNVKMPERCVLCFFADVIKNVCAEAEVVGELGSEIGINPIYRLDVSETLNLDEPTFITVVHPGVDAPLSAAYVEELIAYGAKTFATEITREGDEVIVKWKGENGEGEERFDYLLAATGRRANVDTLGLENTSLERNGRGVPVYDPLSMRAGDAVVDLPLLHEAADEGRLAGENAARLPDAYRRARRIGLGIVFSDPQIGMAGESHRALADAGVDFEVGEVSFEDQGRARVMGVNKGLLRVYGEKGTGRLLGAEMIGPAAEHLTHLIAWSIESGATVSELLNRPFYHPVIEEGLRTALRNLNAALGLGPNPPLRCIDCGPGA